MTVTVTLSVKMTITHYACARFSLKPNLREHFLSEQTRIFNYFGVYKKKRLRTAIDHQDR